MNETTKAILRREAEEKRSAMRHFQNILSQHHEDANAAQARIDALSIEIDDIEAVLETKWSAVVPDGLPHIAPGESLHIHNA